MIFIKCINGSYINPRHIVSIESYKKSDGVYVLARTDKNDFDIYECKSEEEANKFMEQFSYTFF